MKKLVLYSSKHGATKKLAEQIAKETQSEVFNVLEFKNPLAQYDMVIMGASVYAGMLSKDMKKFIVKERDALNHLQVSMFLSGLNKGDFAKVIKENIDERWLAHMLYGDCLGGVLDFSKMSFMERSIIKVINKNGALFADKNKMDCINLIEEHRVLVFIEHVNRIENTTIINK